jgi:hypothetical protein
MGHSTALRYFALDGADHAIHQEQATMIGRYFIWRNNHAYDERLRRVVNRAKCNLMRHQRTKLLLVGCGPARPARPLHRCLRPRQALRASSGPSGTIDVLEHHAASAPAMP